MDVSVITSLVNGVGFPVAAFIAMYYMCVHSLAEVKEALQQNTTIMHQIHTLLSEKKE